MNKTDTYKMAQSVMNKSIHNLGERIKLQEAMLDLLYKHLGLEFVGESISPPSIKQKHSNETGD